MLWLKNCWYAVSWAEDVAPGDKLARTIAGAPVLIWRDAKGTVRALADRCAHRLAPLSLGKIEQNIVRCRYHGLAYDGDTGKCIHNPHGAIVGTLMVKAYPVIERHKMLWIWMGGSDAGTDAIPDLSFIDTTPPLAFSKGYMHAAADHRLLEDNILDLSHGDFLHPDTLGGGSFTRAKISVEERGNTVFVRWVAKNEQAIPIWRPEMADPEMMTDMTTDVLWHPSGVMVLRGGAVPAGAPREEGIDTWNAHIMTPETATSTHYFYCNTRNYRIDDSDYNAAIAAGLAIAFGAEDKPMIEAQQARIGSADLLDCGPTLLSIDNASTRARRIYQRLVKSEQDAIS